MENEHILKKFSDHNHAPEASRVSVSQTLNTMKEMAVHTQDQPIQIIQNALINMPQDSSYYMPNKEALRKQINRTRNDNNMTLQPQSLQDIDVPDNLRVTMNGDQFLAREIELGNEKLMIFCTTSNLQHLQNAEYWIMDGTFKTVPILFQQLYTIHIPVSGEENSCIFSMVYVLMTSRSEESYKRVFEELTELGNQADLDLSPPIVITNFE